MIKIETAKASFQGRDGFASLLNDKGLLGEAVEVGTHRGEFANKFRRMWQGKLLRCVDPYFINYSERDPVSHRSPMERTEDKNTAFRLLAGPLTMKTCRFYICTSNEAARFFEGMPFDFIYLDGSHEFSEVKADLERWWPLIQRGGLLAGHDFDLPGDSTFPWRDTVGKAVREFAEQQDLTIFLVDEPSNGVQSYYMVKPMS